MGMLLLDSYDGGLGLQLDFKIRVGLPWSLDMTMDMLLPLDLLDMFLTTGLLWNEGFCGSFVDHLATRLFLLCGMLLNSIVVVAAHKMVENEWEHVNMIHSCTWHWLWVFFKSMGESDSWKLLKQLELILESDPLIYRLEIYVKDDTKCAMFIVIYDETEKMTGQLAMGVYNIEEKLEVRLTSKGYTFGQNYFEKGLYLDVLCRITLSSPKVEDMPSKVFVYF
ncbi:hypothetical protein DM860_007942 [Cuscuta australis]|uniref:Uncharacterized protein n=1 Tax=Cuscuta australis TaxID=267555 RepID=A0A328E0H5_9ASTE|nr:hypothetical protein DM860_007942 [Cuscuta australis]